MNYNQTHIKTAQPQSGHTFSAKEKDDETGYSYFGARYYDSELSVWLSVDPMASKYPTVSPYNYCFLNPINFIDPFGLDGEPVESKDKAKDGEFRSKDGRRIDFQLDEVVISDKVEKPTKINKDRQLSTIDFKRAFKFSNFEKSSITNFHEAILL